MEWLVYIIYLIVIVTAALTVHFSIRSRRSKEAHQRAIYIANMNINMGIMLVCISASQFLSFAYSTTRLIVGSLFLLIGLFNFFAGVRTRSFIREKQSKPLDAALRKADTEH